MKVKLYRKVLKRAWSFYNHLTRRKLDASPMYSLSHDACSTPDPDDKTQYVVRLAFTFRKAYPFEFIDIIERKYRKHSRKWNMASAKLHRAIESGNVDS